MTNHRTITIHVIAPEVAFMVQHRRTQLGQTDPLTLVQRSLHNALGCHYKEPAVVYTSWQGHAKMEAQHEAADLILCVPPIDLQSGFEMCEAIKANRRILVVSTSSLYQRELANPNPYPWASFPAPAALTAGEVRTLALNGPEVHLAVAKLLTTH